MEQEFCTNPIFIRGILPTQDIPTVVKIAIYSYQSHFHQGYSSNYETAMSRERRSYVPIPFSSGVFFQLKTSPQ